MRDGELTTLRCDYSIHFSADTTRGMIVWKYEITDFSTRKSVKRLDGDGLDQVDISKGLAKNAQAEFCRGNFPFNTRVIQGECGEFDEPDERTVNVCTVVVRGTYASKFVMLKWPLVTYVGVPFSPLATLTVDIFRKLADDITHYC